MTLKLFDFVEQFMMIPFSFNLTQYEKTGPKGKTSIFEIRSRSRFSKFLPFYCSIVNFALIL